MLRNRDGFKFLDIQAAQGLLAVNIGVKIIVVQILRQVD
jgi:hypothetical protein